MTEFTTEQLELLFNAWALHARDRGFVPTDAAIEDCEQLVESGFLEARTLDNGDVSYWWTTRAELALDVNQLTNVEGREN